MRTLAVHRTGRLHVFHLSSFELFRQDTPHLLRPFKTLLSQPLASPSGTRERSWVR